MDRKWSVHTVRSLLQERGVLRAEEPIRRRSSFQRFVCVEASTSLSLHSERPRREESGGNSVSGSDGPLPVIPRTPAVNLEESTYVFPVNNSNKSPSAALPLEEEAHEAGLQLLELSLRWADEAISLLRRLYHADLVEPLTLARLLESKSRAAERLSDSYSKDRHINGVDDLSAFDLMQQAETASRRLLGAAHEVSIRLMLEVLRLHVKYHERPSCYSQSSDSDKKQSFAALKAAEIGVCIVQLASRDLVQADLFTQRCAELLALSTVAAKGGMKVSIASHLQTTTT